MSEPHQALGPSDVSESTGQETEVQTYADLILDYLLQTGSEFIFGVPGGAIEPLFDAIARRRGRRHIRHTESRYHLLARQSPRSTTPTQLIIARHEAGAAYMADGYARETGKLGICCATTGPGATNLITGVASAFADRVPMLVLTAQTALPNFGRRALQESTSDEIDTVGMFERCTRYSTLVSHVDQLERKLVTALNTAFRRPKGPVHLSLPMDLLRTQLPNKGPAFQIGTLFREPRTVERHGLDALWECIQNSEKVAMVIGADCGGAIQALEEFFSLTNIPFVTTPMGKRWVNTAHSGYCGVFGFAGHERARELLTDSSLDFIIVVGSSLGELATSGWDADALLNHKLIHVDATVENFNRSPMACLHVLGDVRSIFSELNQRICDDIIQGQSRLARQRYPEQMNTAPLAPEWVNVSQPNMGTKHADFNSVKFRDRVKPQQLMEKITRIFPEQTRFVCDAGNTWAWATHYLNPRTVGTYRIGMGFGAMTWAIGAAIGTALGRPDVPVVCLTGDGSYLMSGQEITVAVQHRIPVFFVVLNDSALGMVKHGQRLGGGEEIGYELPKVDFAAVACAMGGRGITIRHIEDLDKIDIPAIMDEGIPTLLDVYIDPEEIPPMGSRIRVLKQQSAREDVGSGKARMPTEGLTN